MKKFPLTLLVACGLVLAACTAPQPAANAEMTAPNPTAHPHAGEMPPESGTSVYGSAGYEFQYQ